MPTLYANTKFAPIPSDILFETIIALEDRANKLREEVRNEALHEDVKTIARRQLARVEMSLAHFHTCAS